MLNLNINQKGIKIMSKKLIKDFWDSKEKTPRDGQLKAFEFLQKNIDKKYIFVEAPTGCHEKGYKIINADGKFVNVEDVKIGDKIMGINGTIRTVMELHRGSDEMYKIIPINGESFIVNKGHIMALYITKSGNRYPCEQAKYEEMSVGEYLTKSNSYKHLAKLYRSVTDFDSKDISIPAWTLGFLLGDGCLSALTPSVSISDLDDYLIDTISMQLKQFEIVPKMHKDNTGSKCKQYYLAGTGTSWVNRNKLTMELEILKINVKSEFKFVPDIYKFNSKEIRNDVLSGLLDSDGHYDKNNCFDFISKSKQLSDDVVFLARSLGLKAQSVKCTKTCQNNFSGEYYRVCISGNLEILNIRSKRRIPTPRKQIKNPLVTGFSVEHVGYGEYYGFSLDGDRLYLGHDFIVHHNSGKSLICKTFANYFKHKDNSKKASYILTHQKILQEQYANEFSDVCSFYGKSNYKCENRGVSCEVSSMLRQNPCSKCPAVEASEKAVSNDFTIMNYSLALNHFLYTTKFEKRSLMVLDEAHTLENILVDFNSIDINKTQCEKFKIPFKFSNNLRNIVKWIKDTYLPCMDVNYAKLKNEFEHLYEVQATKLSKDDLSTVKYIDSIGKHLEILYNFLEQSIETIENKYIIIDDMGNIKIKFIYGSENFHTILKPKADKFLFMSATIFDYKEMCRNFNIPESEACFLSLDSEFDVDNRPIIYHPIVKMSYGWENDSNNKNTLLDTIKHILDEHKDDNGVIHTGNFMIAKWLVNELEDNIKHDIFHHNPNGLDSRDACINGFINCKKPSLIISPSVTEGLDLSDGKGRFGIIVKLPYLQLQDLWVKRRMELDKSWYSNCCAKTIIQSTGRIVRHGEDHGINYILDSNFDNLLKYNKNKFPKWWTDSIQML